MLPICFSCGFAYKRIPLSFLLCVAFSCVVYGCVLVLGVCAEQKGVDVGWMWVVLGGGIGECDVSIFVVEVCFMCCAAALL